MVEFSLSMNKLASIFCIFGWLGTVVPGFNIETSELKDQKIN